MRDKFDAIYIDKNSYLIHFCRHIHRNPVEAGSVTNPADWPFSNYQEWIGKRAGSLGDRGFEKVHFPIPGENERFVIDYKTYYEEDSILRELSLE